MNVGDPSVWVTPLISLRDDRIIEIEKAINPSYKNFVGNCGKHRAKERTCTDTFLIHYKRFEFRDRDEGGINLREKYLEKTVNSGVRQGVAHSRENSRPSFDSQLLSSRCTYTSSPSRRTHGQSPEVEVVSQTYTYLTEHLPAYLLRGTHIHFELAVATRARFMREVIFRECETGCVTNLILCHFCGPSRGLHRELTNSYSLWRKTRRSELHRRNREIPRESRSVEVPGRNCKPHFWIHFPAKGFT